MERAPIRCEGLARTSRKSCGERSEEEGLENKRSIIISKLIPNFKVMET